MKIVKNANGTYTLNTCDGGSVTGSYEFCHWVYETLWQKAIEDSELEDKEMQNSIGANPSGNSPSYPTWIITTKDKMHLYVARFYGTEEDVKRHFLSKIENLHDVIRDRFVGGTLSLQDMFVSKSGDEIRAYIESGSQRVEYQAHLEDSLTTFF